MHMLPLFAEVGYVPKVFLLIRTKDLSIVIYKVCNIDEPVAFVIRAFVQFDDGAWYDADVVLSGERSVFVQIDLPLAA
jgi:hypothetical protein